MSIKITPKMFAMLDSNAQSAINGLFLAKPMPVAEVKAKRVLSPEHLAKLKAGRELAKLKKALKTEEPVAAVAAIVAEEPVLPEQPVATVEQKKRGPKPLSTKTPEELAAHKTKVAERKAEREAKKLAEPVPAPEPVLPEPVLVAAPETVLPEAEPVVVAKAKRTLSPEHLAKLKAGRELKKLLQLAAAEMEKDLPPAPVAEPEVAPEPVEAKAKRILSPEHLAKLKAGREAAKAKKIASTLVVTSPEVPRPSIEIPQESMMPEEPVPVAEPVLPEQPVEKKRRGPKKLSDMTPEELAAHKLKVEERKAAKVTFKEPVVEPVQIKFKTA